MRRSVATRDRFVLEADRGYVLESGNSFFQSQCGRHPRVDIHLCGGVANRDQVVVLQADRGYTFATRKSFYGQSGPSSIAILGYSMWRRSRLEPIGATFCRVQDNEYTTR